MARAFCSTVQEKREIGLDLGAEPSHMKLCSVPSSPGQLLNNQSKVSKFSDVARVSPGTDHPLTQETQEQDC